MKILGSFVFVFLIVADSVWAAGWQTPAEAMQLAAIGQGEAPAPTSITIGTQPQFFQITADDVTKSVAQEMKLQGFNVTATLQPAPNGALYSADHPLKLKLHALQIDPEAKLWQGQAYILNNNGTETVKPVAGRYDTTVRVPVVTRQFRQGDVIAESDIAYKTLPERQLRKDTITEASQLIGQSPKRGISADRPLRLAEISQPVLIKKGQTVEMHYTTPFMSIRTSGLALEDGAQGSIIRIKNDKSEKAVTARVTGAGRVEANTESL